MAGGGDGALVYCSFRFMICVDEVDLAFVSSTGSACLSSMICASVAFGVDTGVPQVVVLHNMIFWKQLMEKSLILIRYYF